MEERRIDLYGEVDGGRTLPTASMWGCAASARYGLPQMSTVPGLGADRRG